MSKKHLAWFDEVDKEDVPLVGVKGANLGEMTRTGFPVPPGFIITSTAYREFLFRNNLEIKIQHLLGLIDYTDEKSVEKVSSQIEKLIRDGKLPEEFVGQVFTAYVKLGESFVAIRSSSVVETPSFAGENETYLNVKGEANLLIRIKDCWASLYHANALLQRHQQHISEEHIAIAVPIQKMIESDASGILLSTDPATHNKEVVAIEAIYGLGEMIAQEGITPDYYEVNKKTHSILARKISEQKKMLVKKGAENKGVEVPSHLQKKQKITDEQILKLAELAQKLERHYYFPQEARWAIEKGRIYLVQTRPLTTTQQMANEDKKVEGTVSPFLLKGIGVTPGIVTGAVRVVRTKVEFDRFKQGEILVAEETNPDFITTIKKAGAIITDKETLTSHGAIIAREFGIPAVVGTEVATKRLRDGELVTVNGLTGEVSKGSRVEEKAPEVHPFAPRVHTATKVYVNVGDPDRAPEIATFHVDGVGLLRGEFLIAGIGVHPKKMIEEKKEEAYIAHLVEGITTFAKSFSPRPVVYRASDFNTSEYRQLIGGKEYEPVETNPLLGNRGAYRYMHDPEIFGLELEALKRVRNKEGLRNVWLMVPFVRTVAELIEVKQIIASHGLYRSSSFKIWMMIEVPSNVILLDQLLEQGIDGVSIGSNDLTMLTLGVDRDTSEMGHEYNEQDESLLWSYEHVIRTAHKYNVTVSFCGQAASNYPSLLKKLVDWGVTSVSVNPDVIDITRSTIAHYEKELLQK